MSDRRIAVVVLMNTNWQRIARNTEVVRIALEGLQPGELREVPIPCKEGQAPQRQRQLLRLTKALVSGGVGQF